MPKRLAITNEQTQRQLDPSATNVSLQSWFEATYNWPLATASVSEILSSRYAHLDDLPAHRRGAKRQRTEHWPELETALSGWIQEARQSGTFSVAAIRAKAVQLWPYIYPEKVGMVPSFSYGWLYRFQARWGVKSRPRRGKASDANARGDPDSRAPEQAANQEQGEEEADAGGEAGTDPVAPVTITDALDGLLKLQTFYQQRIHTDTTALQLLRRLEQCMGAEDQQAS
ncbi:uncharacterized protein BP01DRAFT_15220 [Aspergillus saccharolyticus JOP 1030-1]|uniref:HTH CENPB-type domain-containing protein n=1 Tax=Aspergillus saccharolyticus JOP 1030-1 TaxID=1450539 RepID=A0A318ZHK2_9EURO|nr:hypothetical protein BP01DRAFT_15220 [Aspergillus saccharolyticus JOP 1030-1]PYH46415.1 hypothetical protein BP01DRAFT_15220 [Aspergillus saccharolyticus JOP 1030-1]